MWRDGLRAALESGIGIALVVADDGQKVRFYGLG